MSSVWTKLENNAYQNREPYPIRPRKPSLSKTATPAEIRAYADQLEQYEEELRGTRERMAAYNALTAALEAEFRADLEEYYGMTGHPKADLLYSKSWERGHAYGLSEVANVYSDLVDLVL
jgi:hypothetical protein